MDLDLDRPLLVLIAKAARQGARRTLRLVSKEMRDVVDEASTSLTRGNSLPSFALPSRMPFLRSLDLMLGCSSSSRATWTGQDFASLALLTQLKDLTLRDGPQDADHWSRKHHVYDASALGSLTQLENLELYVQHPNLYSAVHLQHLTGLRSLTVVGHLLGDQEHLSKLVSLETMIFDLWDITDMNLFSTLKNLKHISVHGDIVPAVLPKFVALETLTLERCNDPSMIVISGLPSLKKVRLDNCSCTVSIEDGLQVALEQVSA